MSAEWKGYCSHYLQEYCLLESIAVQLHVCMTTDTATCSMLVSYLAYQSLRQNIRLLTSKNYTALYPRETTTMRTSESTLTYFRIYIFADKYVILSVSVNMEWVCLGNWNKCTLRSRN
jgi:hypothetical protein